jgi:hypothetical protein
MPRGGCLSHGGRSLSAGVSAAAGWPRGGMQNAEVRMQNGDLTGLKLSQERGGSIGRIGRIGRIGLVGHSARLHQGVRGCPARAAAPRHLLPIPPPPRCASNGSRLAEWYPTPPGLHVGSGETSLTGGARGWPRGETQNAESRQKRDGCEACPASRGENAE